MFFAARTAASIVKRSFVIVTDAFGIDITPGAVWASARLAAFGRRVVSPTQYLWQRVDLVAPAVAMPFKIQLRTILPAERGLNKQRRCAGRASA